MRTKTNPEHAIFDSIVTRMRAVEQIVTMAAAAKRHPTSRMAEWAMSVAERLLAQIEAEGALAAPDGAAKPARGTRRARAAGKRRRAAQ